MSEPQILAKLRDVTRTTNGWSARCPAHDDKNPSLSISVGEDGRVLVHCFAGCQPQAVLKAVDMTFKDLGPERHEVAVYSYHDQSGQLVYEVVRYEPKDFRMRRPDGHGGWSWSLRGIQRVAYRLPELRGHERVLFVEGEKDADALAAAGLPATTTSGGAAAWQDDYADQLAAAGANEVIVLPDNDGPGREYATKVAAALTARGITVRVLELPGLSEKGDVSDWLDAGGTADELKELVEQAPTFDAWRGTDDVRPVIDIRDGDWRRIVEEAYEALVLRNRRTGGPWMFVGPENLVRVVRRVSDHPSSIQIETDDTLRGYLMRNVTFLSGRDNAPKSVVPPSTVLRDILTRPTWTGLPELRGVIETPVLSRDGEVIITAGYQSQTQLWYSPAPGFELPPIPERPTISDMTRARDLLVEVVSDFPFDGPGSRANALALMLPALRARVH